MQDFNLKKLTEQQLEREEAKEILLKAKVPLDRYFKITDELIKCQNDTIEALQELQAADEVLIQRYEQYIVDLGGELPWMPERIIH